MGINDFIDSADKAKKFDIMRKGKTKEEVRQLEQKFLKPSKLPAYHKPENAKDALISRTIKLVFVTEADVELFKKHFKVSTYKENNVLDTNLLIALLTELEEGRLAYDEKAKLLRYTKIKSRNSK